IDVRPFFRIDRDNKENRFHRALQFYRRERVVMRALDDYVVERHNAVRKDVIGGARFLSLRLSYPAPGERITPYERLPLASHGRDVRHEWYWTPKSRRVARCAAEGAPPPPPAPAGHDDAEGAGAQGADGEDAAEGSGE